MDMPARILIFGAFALAASLLTQGLLASALITASYTIGLLIGRHLPGGA
jgi:hypothetical protein